VVKDKKLVGIVTKSDIVNVIASKGKIWNYWNLQLLY